MIYMCKCKCIADELARLYAYCTVKHTVFIARFSLIIAKWKRPPSAFCREREGMSLWLNTSRWCRW